MRIVLQLSRLLLEGVAARMCSQLQLLVLQLGCLLVLSPLYPQCLRLQPQRSLAIVRCQLQLVLVQAVPLPLLVALQLEGTCPQVQPMVALLACQLQLVVL